MADFVLLSLKGLLCFALLLMPVALGDKNISLKIKNISPSEVKLSCVLDFNGDMTGIFFDIYKAGYSCLHSTSDRCLEVSINNCGINCLSYEHLGDMKALQFLVKLNGSCDEVIPIRCTIRNAGMLYLEQSIQLAAQSNPPVISVNDSQPLKASSEPVQINCTMTNMCYKTKLEISVDVPVQHVNITYAKEGSRFNTTAIYEAIFTEAGNYTIVCKETGKEDSFSRSYSLAINHREKVSKHEDDEHFYYKSLTGIIIIFLIIFLISATLGIAIFIVWRRKTIKRRSDAEASPQAECEPLLRCGRERYTEIEKLIQKLTCLNINQYARRILQMSEEGEITHPEAGNSIIYQLAEKIEDFYKEPLYTRIIQALFPSYRKSALYEKEYLAEIIWNRLEYKWIQDESDVQECIKKLEVFLPVDPILSLRLSWRCAMDSLACNMPQMHGSKVLSFCMTEAADQEDGCHNSAKFDLSRDSISILKTILDKNMEISSTHEGALNFIIQSTPSLIFEHDSNLSPVKELIAKHCLEIIKKKPALIDHVDAEGNIPLQNLIKKLMADDLWKKISTQNVETDSLWELMSQLITNKNVNIEDKDQVTLYSWIIFWKESLPFQEVPDKQLLSSKIEDILQICKAKGASEEDACSGVHILRNREMGGLLKRMVSSNVHMKTDELTLKQLTLDVQRTRNLISKGYGRSIRWLTVTEDIKDVAQTHLEIRNDRICNVSETILEVMIDEGNAQQIYDILLKRREQIESNEGKLNCYALFAVLKLCLDKGARPTTEEIDKISLLNVDVCKTYEAQLATIQMMERLIGAYRKKGKTEPIGIYLNPIQDQWKVTKELRTAASRVIRAAYCTLDNCMKSESVVNMLLFLRKDDGVDEIRRCFENVEELLQEDMKESPVNVLLKGNVEAVDERQLKETLIRRNDNWLERSVLHLAVMLCHDEYVMNCIPREKLQRLFNAKDLHMCTPLFIAHLHRNDTAIGFLESNEKILYFDYFYDLYHNFPEFLTSAYTVADANIYLPIVATNLTISEVTNAILASPINQCAAVQKDLKELFKRMVSNDGLLNAEILMGDSVREKLKVGNWNEFNLQIHVKASQYLNQPFPSIRVHEYLIKRLAEIDKNGISLRCTSVNFPWRFIWDKEDRCEGQEILVHVVLILVNGKQIGLETQERQQLMIDNAPCREKLRYLEWNDFKSEPSWNDTFYQQECDILDNLPPQCCLGIIICTSLLETQHQALSINILKNVFTAHVVKNTLLWILAGITPGEVECEYGNVIGRRYGALRLQLCFRATNPKWMTEKDLQRFASDGRFWAEKIFDAILFMATKYRITLGNFLTNRSDELNSHEVVDVYDTCERCLEQLRPQNFFCDRECSSSEISASDCGLRTRLQEVINRLCEESESPSAAVPGKTMKEVKELITWVDNTSYVIKKEADISLPSDFGLLQGVGCLCLLRKERQLKEMDTDIDRFLEQLSIANQLESQLLREIAVFEEAEMEKREPYKDLTMKVNSIRTDCQSDLENLEQKLELLTCHTGTVHLLPSYVERAESEVGLKICLYFE